MSLYGRGLMVQCMFALVLPSQMSEPCKLSTPPDLQIIDINNINIMSCHV